MELVAGISRLVAVEVKCAWRSNDSDRVSWVSQGAGRSILAAVRDVRNDGRLGECNHVPVAENSSSRKAKPCLPGILVPNMSPPSGLWNLQLQYIFISPE